MPGPTEPPPAGAHPLRIKVLRLAQPRLASVRTVLPLEAPAAGAAVDDVAAAVNAVHDDDLATRTGALTERRPTGLSELLTLPRSAEAPVLLGEVLACHVALVNDGDQPAENVNLRVEMQTATQRHVLCDTTAASAGAGAPSAPSDAGAPPPTRPLPGLEARGGTTGFVAQHEVKELGSHVLVVSAQYAVGLQTRALRRLFRFQAANPLSVKTKSHSLANGSCFLEVQLHNTAGCLLALSPPELHPSELFECEQLGAVAEPLHLPAGAVEQLLYVLCPRAPGGSAHRSVAFLGKLDLQWRSTASGRGHLQTAPLPRRVPPAEPLSITVLDATRGALAERPLLLACLVRFDGPEWTLAALRQACGVDQLDDSGAPPQIAVQGVRGKMLVAPLRGANRIPVSPLVPAPDGAPVTVAPVLLELVPLVAGLVRVSGLQLVEVSSGSALHSIENLCAVWVSRRASAPADASRQVAFLEAESSRVRQRFSALCETLKAA